MARIRTIKPEFFTDTDIAELPPLTRLFFIGLWCVADRAGRLEDNPRKLKALILPYDEFDADAALDELHQSAFIVRYESDGRRYCTIRTFLDHQRPHPQEKASTIPEPTADQQVTGCREKVIQSREKVILSSESTRRSKEGREGKGREYGVRSTERSLAAAPPTPMPLVSRRRRDAAFEGPRLYVPQRWHADAVALRNHPDAERELLAWYERVSEAWTTGEHAGDNPGSDMFMFWRARFNEEWPPSKAAGFLSDTRPAWLRAADALKAGGE